MRWLALGIFSLFTTGCSNFLRDDVPRKIHGRIYESHFISEQAYASYLEASIAERYQDWQNAERAYLQVISYDSKSPDPWIRIGAIRCKRGAYPEAQQAFSKAVHIESDFAPLLREQARCAYSRGASIEAHSFALQAIEQDPSDSISPLLLAQIAFDSKDLPEARRWLNALALREPTSPNLQAFLKEHPHPAFERLYSNTSYIPLPIGNRISLDQLDRALSIIRPEEAYSLANKAKISPGELVVRAAALGLTELAQIQSKLILEADPGNMDAQIAFLESSNQQTFLKFLTQQPLTKSVTTPPSIVGTLLLARLLLRKSGPDAARMTIQYLPEIKDDALAQRLFSGLKERLNSM